MTANPNYLLETPPSSTINLWIRGVSFPHMILGDTFKLQQRAWSFPPGFHLQFSLACFLHMVNPLLFLEAGSLSEAVFPAVCALGQAGSCPEEPHEVIESVLLKLLENWQHSPFSSHGPLLHSDGISVPLRGHRRRRQRRVSLGRALSRGRRAAEPS